MDVTSIPIEPRLALSIIYVIGMAFCLTNAILIWAHNPGNELRVWPRAGFHAAVFVFITSAFIIRARSEPSPWTWQDVALLGRALVLAVFAIALTWTIMGQVENDRAERRRLRDEAERRIQRRQQEVVPQ